jgi:hypothetical protein
LYYYYYYYYYYLTAIGSTPSDSSIHLHTNSTQNIEHGTHITIIGEKQLQGKNNNLEKITIQEKTIKEKITI